MATIRKRGDTWQAQVRRQGAYPVSRTFKSKSDAQVWARSMESQIDRADLPVGFRELSKLTLGTLIERYLIEVTPRKRSAAKEGYRLRRILAHRIGACPLSKLSPSMIASYREERLAEVKAQAVRHDLNVLGHLLKHAIREWGIPLAKNPVSDVAKPSPSKARERRLGTDELEQLEAATSRETGQRLLPIIRFAIATGMRRGEIVAVQWCHVDLKECLLHIPVTKNGHPRTIPLSSAAIEILNGLARGPDGSPVFQVTASWVRFAWDQLARRSGIVNLHFHDLRHEAISRFFEKGLTIPEVALISGHRDVRQLFRYTHLRAENVVAKLG
jgi:integrase